MQIKPKYTRQSHRQQHRSGGLRSLSVMTEKLIAPVMRNRVKILAKIITNWQQISGEVFSYSDPIDIQFAPNRRHDGTLVLSVSPGTGPIVQMMSQHIIDKVNAMAGFGMVGRIKLVQNMRPHTSIPPSPAENPKAAPCDEVVQNKLEAQTQHIQTPQLRAALLRLGQHIHAESEE